MNRANFGAVRLPFLVAAVLAFLAVPTFAQVVERGRTLADLIASHPCDTGLTNRIARVIDCDAADDIGDGDGAFQCWAICDGSAPWVTQAIGGGGSGGIGGSTGATDNAILRADGAGGATAQSSAVTIADTTGDLQWEGTTANDFEGNFTFADPTADWTLAFNATGRATFPGMVIAENYTVLGNGAISELENLRIVSSSSISFSNGTDYSRSMTGAGVTGPVVKVNSAINLAPLASPPRTCDATAEGDIYSDTSHALCFCDGTSWNVLTGSGAGSCV